MKSTAVLKRLISYVGAYKMRLLGIIVLALTGVFFEVTKPLPVKIVIDNVLADNVLPFGLARFFNNPVTAESKLILLYCTVGFLIVISAASFFITLKVFRLTMELAQKLVTDLMIDFYNKLQRMSVSFYASNKTGDLMQRISGDVFVAYFVVAQIILPALTSVLGLGIMFYIMLKIDMMLAFVAMSVVPLMVLLLAAFSKTLDRTTTLQYKIQGSFSAFLQQSLVSMKIIQAFGRESYMDKKLKSQAKEFSTAYINANKVAMSYNQSVILMTGIAGAVLILLGAHRGIKGQISAGDLFVFLGYLAGLFGPVNSLGTAIAAAVTIGSRGKRVFEILDSKEVVKEKENAISKFSARGDIEFRNVRFNYTSSEETVNPVLNDISFQVKAGDVVAIVGTSGTGKTSLISLLTRFYDPLSGAILLDGVNINELKLQVLREQISLVLQDPFIFPMTIGENIGFGNPEASFDSIQEAAKAAQAHDFIMRTEYGYETPISEAGTTLSGGEKQRIAIARALLKKAPILIMDEPTSAVDAITESKIFAALHKYAKNKTVFLISHRLSAIKHADKIIMIKDGRLGEEGTHDALIQNGKLYSDLYKYQHLV